MVLDSLLPKSLRVRLMVLVALAMTPIAVMTLVNTWQEYENAIRTAEENLVRLTRLAAANEAQSIEGARQILVDISSFPNLLDDDTRCSELLHNILRQNKSYANFGVIQMNGDVTCSAIPSARPVNLGDRLHFKRAVQERRFIAGNYVFGRVIQKHTINLTYPIIHADNEVKAVVFAAMDLEDLDSFVRDINLPAGSILITADEEGKIISRQPDPQAWFGKSVSEVMMKTMQQEPGKPVLVRGVDGVERLHAFARVGGADISEYTLTIGIPRDTIIANAQRGQMLALGALAATILLAMLAAWLIGNILIVRRIERLVDTADRIASGSLDTRTGVRYGNEEIGKLARALDKMASALQIKEAEQLRATEELRAADRRKDEFLAMLAHELRNPLAPISTGAQILLLQHGDDPHIGKTLEIISRQVDHMTSLVDDLLDVSRVTRGLIVIERERLDVKQIVSDALDQASPLISTHGHALNVRMPDDSLHVDGDYKRLVQVLTNLLNNAAKYTPAGGRIDLDIEALPGEIILSVTDTGQGMPPELIQRVFELFVQAERTSDRSEGGLGLGLALVKSLVELHGGSVSARSAGPGKGSTFTVRLPRLPEDGNLNLPSNDTGHMAAVSSRMRVLVVDDNVDATRTLSSFLSVLGYDVRAAFNGANALVIAREWHPQVCLLDIGLPDIDGRDLAATLRRTPETAQSVLIAITGYGQESDRRTALEAGFHHYFVKPVSTQELSHVLAEIKP